MEKPTKWSDCNMDWSGGDLTFKPLSPYVKALAEAVKERVIACSLEVTDVIEKYNSLTPVSTLIKAIDELIETLIPMFINEGMSHAVYKNTVHLSKKTGMGSRQNAVLNLGFVLTPWQPTIKYWTTEDMYSSVGDRIYLERVQQPKNDWLLQKYTILNKLNFCKNIPFYERDFPRYPYLILDAQNNTMKEEKSVSRYTEQGEYPTNMNEAKMLAEQNFNLASWQPSTYTNPHAKFLIRDNKPFSNYYYSYTRARANMNISFSNARADQLASPITGEFSFKNIKITPSWTVRKRDIYGDGSFDMHVNTPVEECTDWSSISDTMYDKICTLPSVSFDFNGGTGTISRMLGNIESLGELWTEGNANPLHWYLDSVPEHLNIEVDWIGHINTLVEEDFRFKVDE